MARHNDEREQALVWAFVIGWIGGMILAPILFHFELIALWAVLVFLGGPLLGYVYARMDSRSVR